MLINTQLNINPTAWAAWKNDPVTQEVLRALQVERDDFARRLIEGVTLDSVGREISLTAQAVGVVYGLDCILIGVEETLREQWEEIKQERLEKEEIDGN